MRKREHVAEESFEDGVGIYQTRHSFEASWALPDTVIRAEPHRGFDVILFCHRVEDQFVFFKNSSIFALVENCIIIVYVPEEADVLFASTIL
jgi:hypothetical protein